MYGPDHPDVVRLQRQVSGLEKGIAASAKPGDDSATSTGTDNNDLRRKLEGAQAALAEAVGRYGPEHPDRVRLQRAVDSLQAQLAAAPTSTPAPPKFEPREADNPAFVQIQAQLSATLNDLTALDEQLGKLRARSLEYQRNVSLAPQVEQQYREIMRDYDNTRLKYSEIRSKQSEAKTAQNLEADRKGERFTLIDPPLPPEEPISPNRRMIFVLGFILSAGFTAGVLWLFETLDSSVRGRLDLLRLTGVPPLALVPHIGTDAERRASRRRMRLAVGSAVASLCVAVALTHFLYRPLDVLWFTFARRMGF
jgi:uncharacterized protein involved in exopolysaccharide biosynthesis